MRTKQEWLHPQNYKATEQSVSRNTQSHHSCIFQEGSLYPKALTTEYFWAQKTNAEGVVEIWRKKWLRIAECPLWNKQTLVVLLTNSLNLPLQFLLVALMDQTQRTAQVTVLPLDCSEWAESSPQF